MNKKKQYNLGGGLKDLGMGLLNAVATPLEVITGKNIVDPAYHTQMGKSLGKGLDAIQGLATGAAPTVANMLLPGSGAALAGLQNTAFAGVQDNSVYGNTLNSAAQGMGAAGSMIMPFMAMGGNMYPDGGKINTLEGDLISKILMERNRDKEFVKRAFNPESYPNHIQQNEDGTTSTHRMAWATDDNGQAWMFPTIFNDADEAIAVPNQYADYISSEGYKKATGMMAMGGNLTEYKNGGSHEQSPFGGIPIGQDALVEQGETRNKDFIYSDRLKPKGSKKSFAALSKEIESKYKGRENDVAANKAKQQALDELAQQQESLKEAQLTKELIKKFNTTATEFANGGFLGGPGNGLPQNFWEDNTNYFGYTGINIDPIQGIQDDINVMNNYSDVAPYANPRTDNPFNLTTNYTGLTPEQQRLVDMDHPIEGINKLPQAQLPEMSDYDAFINFLTQTQAMDEPTEDMDATATMSQEEIDQTAYDNRDIDQPIIGINPMGGASTFQQPGIDMLNTLVQDELSAARLKAEQDIINKVPVIDSTDSSTSEANDVTSLEELNKYINKGTALASIPDIFNLIKAAKGPDDVNLERFTPEKINLEEQRRQAKDQARMAQNIARQNIKGTMSGGQAFAGQLASDVAIEKNLQDAIGQSFMTEEMQNAQIANQAGLTNTQIANKEYIMREQNKALVDSLISQSIAGLSQTGQSHFKDLGATIGQDRMNKLIINAINEGVLTDFTLDSTGGLKYKNTKKEK